MGPKMNEGTVYIFYDIADDTTRNRVANACKDYGLAEPQPAWRTLSPNSRGLGEPSEQGVDSPCM